jgi:hypothetical protein
MQTEVSVAVTGTKHYYGVDFFKIGMIVRLRKDRDNPHDSEAIVVEIPPIGRVGYVANSLHTVPKGCRSAGRIYDTFGEVIYGIVRFVVKDIVILEVTDQVEEWHILKKTDTSEQNGFLFSSTDRIRVDLNCVHHDQ